MEQVYRYWEIKDHRVLTNYLTQNKLLLLLMVPFIEQTQLAAR